MTSRRDRVAVVVEGLRTRRWPKILGIVAMVLLLLFFVGGGWYFSGMIRSDALLVKEFDPEYDFEVTGATGETITFALPADPADDLVSSEVLGIRWEDGYGLSGEVVSRTDGAIAKQFTLLTGPPPAAGTMVAFEGNAVPPDPADAGVAYETVTYPAALGEFEAWLTPGGGETWAIFVHGRGATLHEGVRILPAFEERGIPVLLIEYRNDPGAPVANDHLATFGVDEWADLESAVRYALDRGATDVVLVGYSMGGAIVVSFLYQSDLADRVAGVVLDAPALELGAMVDLAAGDTTLIPGLPFTVPITLTATAKWMTGVRFGADWGAMDYLDDRVATLTVPILVLHGVEDATVPIALSRELADRRPDIVVLEEFRGADHVRSWNVDAGRYEAAVGGFLDRVVP